MDITSAAVATVIATLFNATITFVLNKRSEDRWLHDRLDTILKISIEYPYLEDSRFTTTWKTRNADDERFIRYDNYCTLVFNFLSRVCSRYRFSKDRIESFINVKDWVRLHRQCWQFPTVDYENTDSYTPEFRKFMEEYLK